MISNPKYGWCEFKLKDFTGTPSYLANVPLDLLDAFINYYNNGYGTVVFDEEGSYFIFVITEYNYGVYIIEEKNESVLYDFSDMNIEELAKELITDLEEDLDGWVYFVISDNAEEIKIRRDEIRNKIAILRKYISRN